MKHPITTLAAAAALAAPSAAQFAAIPPQYRSLEGVALSSVPFAVGGAVRCQTVYHRDLLGAFKTNGIRSVALRGNAGAVSAGITVELEVIMATCPNPPWALDPTFANNRGPDARTVLPRQQVSLPALSGLGSPQPFDIAFALATPFSLGTSGHLLVEWVVHQGSPGAAGYLVDGSAFEPAGQTHHGGLCGVSGPQLVLANWTSPSSQLELQVLAGPAFANGAAVSFLGQGFLPVPVPLPLGGCPVHVAPLASVVVGLDASGQGKLAFPLPPTAKGLTAASQYVAIDAGTTRLGTTQATQWTIGGYDAVGAVVSQVFSHAAGMVSQGAPILGLQ